MSKVSNVKTGAAAAPNMSVAQRILADAGRVVYETDAVGRKIGIKKLDFLDTHQITCLLKDDSQIALAVLQSMLVASVVNIDGQEMTMPRSRSDLNARMKLLDFHGIEAVKRAMEQFTPIIEDSEDALKN